MPVVESRIDTVVLYQQGARVTRRLLLDCPDGKPPTELEIARLPLSLFDPTVRVRVLSTETSQADLSATHVRVGLWIPPRETPLETVDQAALRSLHQQVRALESQLREQEWEMSILGNIPIPPRPEPEEGKPPPPSPLGPRMALEQFSHEGVQSRLAEARKLREQLRRLNEEVAVLEQKIAQASTAREVTAAELYKSVHVQLRHSGAALARAELSIEYFIPGARWAPSYQCRLSRDCREVELVMRALIAQHSGEDWRGVKLVLSTASPMTWTELPELPSIRIGRAQPPPAARAGFRPAPQGAAALFADYDRDRGTLLRRLPASSPYSLSVMEAPVDLEDGYVAESAPSLPEPRRDKERKKKGSRREMREMSSRGPADGMALDDEADEVLAAPAAEMASYEEEAYESEAPPPPPSLAPIMSAPAPMPAAAPARAAPKSMAVGGRAPARPSAAGPGGASPTQSGLEAVVFTHLRLSSATDSANRNRLQPVDSRRFYLEMLARFSVTVTFDVMAVVAEAENRARSVAQMPLPGGAVDARSIGGYFDFSYAADATVDVPSDGVFHSVALGSRTGEASVLYVAVPREDTNVYRQAQVKNPLSAPMLTGPAEVYVGGEYVLSTTLPAVAPRGDFKLGLGVEQAIRCARNTKYREARTGTKIVATTELWHDLLIDLANNLDREIVCEVRERIPQPAEEAEVVVEEGTVTPAWEPYTQEERTKPLEGGRRWRVTVPANSTMKLAAQYVVKLYANNELNGGNRREA
ncbi:mucoidy inhibitor MuiA family protein [Hyalangium sp.]|uniref:mucoidy inhibitor MuiA family protein n=1 Tax=Hyalangium sp. TaxID=2028555 RepID=UPI002D6BE098|nr:mucoidy inhibitor MuiA family protein [Hyalangium sp.]HYH98593.1 mucoidy inhibitor MuiA family protein [Hyalangium sp.]